MKGKTMEFITLGCDGNAKLTFDVSRSCDLDYLHIEIGSRVCTDFVNKITINGVTRDDIDSICKALCRIKVDILK